MARPKVKKCTWSRRRRNKKKRFVFRKEWKESVWAPVYHPCRKSDVFLLMRGSNPFPPPYEGCREHSNTGFRRNLLLLLIRNRKDGVSFFSWLSVFFFSGIASEILVSSILLLSNQNTSISLKTICGGFLLRK